MSRPEWGSIFSPARLSGVARGSPPGRPCFDGAPSMSANMTPRHRAPAERYRSLCAEHAAACIALLGARARPVRVVCFQVGGGQPAGLVGGSSPAHSGTTHGARARWRRRRPDGRRLERVGRFEGAKSACQPPFVWARRSALGARLDCCRLDLAPPPPPPQPFSGPLWCACARFCVSKPKRFRSRVSSSTLNSSEWPLGPFCRRFTAASLVRTNYHQLKSLMTFRPSELGEAIHWSRERARAGRDRNLCIQVFH